MKKSSRDPRPESYKIDADSLTILRELDSKKDLEEKRRIVLPLVEPSLELLQEKYRKQKTSLGIIKPLAIDDFIVEETSREWTPKEKMKLSQESFFDRPEQIKQLEKLPYNFYFSFRCKDPFCKNHKMRITSWELNQAYRRYLVNYSTEKEAIQKLKDKYLSFFSPEYDGYFFAGTTLPYPSFIIIGHFSYPIKNIKKDKVTEGQTDFFHLL